MKDRFNLDTIFSLLIVYSGIGFLFGQLQFLSPDGFTLVSGWSWKASSIVVAVLLCFRGRRSFVPESLVIAFALLFLSDYFKRNFIFYADGIDRAVIVTVGVLFVGLAQAARGRFMNWIFSWKALVVIQAVVAIAFLRYADGRLIFSDDHPSFLYRLQVMWNEFPAIPFFNTDWNAGFTSREVYATGTLNLYLLSFPLVLFFPDLNSPEGAKLYTVLIPYIFTGLVPVGSYFAARNLGCSKRGAIASAVFSLGPTLAFFEWLLQFGTFGFAISVAFAPLAYALLRRVLFDEDLSWMVVLGCAAALSICIAWSLSIFFFVALCIAAAPQLPKLLAPERRSKTMGLLLIMILLNGWWVARYVREFDVLRFFGASALPGSNAVSVEGASREESGGDLHVVKDLRGMLTKMNPLLLLLFPLGMAHLSRRDRWAVCATIFVLGLLAVCGGGFKPQLELRRMIVPVAFFLATFAGEGLVVFLDRCLSCGTSVIRLVCATCALGMFIATPLDVAAIYTNHSEHRAVYANKTVWDIVDAIKQHGGEGRTFFSGFILHELGSPGDTGQRGGHVAPLPRLSGKPLYASHFYHARWSSVDPIPKSYRDRGEAGIEEFLDLVNATAVVTYKREWADYCARGTRYQEVFHGGRFRLFTRTPAPGGYFLEGTGRVLVSGPNRIELIPGSEAMVLKFRYLRGLRVTGPGRMEPVPVFSEDVGGGVAEQVSFVRLIVPAEVVKSGQRVKISY